MKKRFTLMMIAALLAVAGVQAKTVKERSLDLSSAYKEWSADNITIDGNTFSVAFNNNDYGNAAISWLGGTATDISMYDYLILELSEPSTSTVEVVVSLGGFWGQYSSSVLEQGKTTLALKLSDLKVTNAGDTDPYKVGDPVDLTKVNLIFIRSGWVHEQVIKVKDFYFANKYEEWDITSFNWDEGQFVWGGENATVDTSEKRITKTNGAWEGNNAYAWFNYVATDISAYDRLVLELDEPSNGPIELVVSDGGFWGGKCHSAILAAGQTKLSLKLSELKITGTPGAEETWATGDPLDLTKVNLIFIRTDNGTAQQVINVKDLYFANQKVVNYDQVSQTIVWDATSFNWDEGKFEWGAEGATVDRANKVITKTTDAWVGNNAYAWLNYVATDISGYDRLVLELDEPSNGPIELVVSNGGFWGGKCHSSTLAAGQTSLSLKLSDLKITGTPGDQDTWATGDPLDLEHVNLIFIRTDNGTAQQVINVKDLYFAIDSYEYTLVRNNDYRDKYGTICLPFAAEKPSNAIVYDIVGWNDTKVYMDEVTTLEAGKAYMYKSTDGEDIAFTKTSTDELLGAPLASTNMLVGQFSGSAYVPVDSYILKNGAWKKVVKADSNTVKNYRAYLTLSNDLQIPASIARERGLIAWDMETGETTGIEDTMISTKYKVQSTIIYDLQGRRVAHPTRGLYIVNGKKIYMK